MGCGGSSDKGEIDAASNAPYDKDTHDAASKIQAVVRGRAARKQNPEELKKTAKEQLSELEGALEFLQKGSCQEIIQFVCARSPELVHHLRVEYNSTKRCLLTNVSEAMAAIDDSDMGEDAKEALKGLIMDRDEYDATCIFDAVARAGTNELELSEVLCHRRGEEIKGINMAYKRLYSEDMKHAIADDVSGHLEKLYIGILDSDKCGGDNEQAEKDADHLHKLLKEKFPAQHDAEVAEIFMTRTVHYRHKIYKAYLKKFREPLDQEIEKHLSAVLGVSDISVALGLMVKPPHWSLADTLYEALEGGNHHESHHTVTRIFLAQRGRHLPAICRYLVEEYSEGRTIETYLKKYKGVYREIMEGLYKYHGQAN